MEITSLKFISLVLFAVFIYYSISKKYQTLFLAVVSCAFIASHSLVLFFYIILFALANYYFGILILKSTKKILYYRLGVLFNILQLVLLRYSGFVIDPIIGLFNSGGSLSFIADFIIPIGISYFTLQAIGYLINLKMGWEKEQRTFLDFFLYIVFFPKFLSGPIERSNHFIPQLVNQKQFDKEVIFKGLRTVMFGFLKKVAIANQLAPFIFKVLSDTHTMDTTSLIFVLFLFPLYLYFDFSGYTDIAIGIAKLFGIDLLPNFSRPFFSRNMTNFWQRFHISLSAWFGDYIYKQTMFKRRKWGKKASLYAVFVTWILFGIWHGAGWNFMLLGVLQALAINYEFFTRKYRSNLFNRLPSGLSKWLARMFTYMFYSFALLFFFSPDIKTTFYFISELKLFSEHGLFSIIQSIPLSATLLIIIYLIIEFVEEDLPQVFERIQKWWFREDLLNTAIRWSVYSLVLCVVFVLGTKVQQFIYVQF